MNWSLLILLVFLFQVVTILISEYRHPAKAVAWLAILFFLPVIGFVMYYFLAKGYTQRRKVKRKSSRWVKEWRRDLIRQSRMPADGQRERLPIEEDVRLFGLLANLPVSSMSKCNETEIYNNGPDAFDSMIEAMEAAKDHIHLEYYTIRDDATGRRFQDVMVRKAKEGVKVRLLYDGIGSLEMTERYLRRLSDAGVESACFLPPLIALFDKRINYRNHRKITVVDGCVGFLGGMNLGDEYIGKHPRLGYWRDTQIRIYGEAVYNLQHTFLQDWHFVTGKLPGESRYFPEIDCAGNELVQIVNSGPDIHWDTILEMYFSAIASAKHRVFITTPYFIPEPGINLALKTAANSGVDVRIILPSVPDTHVVYWASLSYVEELLQAGVRFFMYERGFIHAKVLIVDKKLASVGTANLDMRSFFSNFEQNAVLFNRKAIDRLEKDFLQDLKDSRELQLAAFEQRSRWQKGKEKAARLLSPLF